MTRAAMQAMFWTLLCGIALAGCAGPDHDPELVQAERVARYLTSARGLRQSMYVSVRENDSPSGLVSYLFSTMGATERPPSGDLSEMEQEQARAIQMPVLPANVTLVPFEPDPRLGKQIVIKADDAQHLIIVDAYLTPNQPPQFTNSWSMPEFRQR